MPRTSPLANNLINRPLPQRIAGRQMQALGRLTNGLGAAIAEQDRRAPAGADHHVGRILVDDRSVSSRDSNRPTAGPQADDV